MTAYDLLSDILEKASRLDERLGSITQSLRVIEPLANRGHAWHGRQLKLQFEQAKAYRALGRLPETVAALRFHVDALRAILPSELGEAFDGMMGAIEEAAADPEGADGEAEIDLFINVLPGMMEMLRQKAAD